MSTAEMREQAKDYVDLLSAEKLLVAEDFLVYLADEDEIDAAQQPSVDEVANRICEDLLTDGILIL